METELKPTPGDLPIFLPYACGQLGLEFDVKITVVMEDEFVNKVGLGDIKKKSATNIKKNQSTIRQSDQSGSVARSSRFAEEESGSDGGIMVVRLNCVVAGPKHVTVALELDRNRAVPLELLRLLRMCAPYNQKLTRFSARWSAIQPAALRELAALLPLGNISDVRLDDTRAGASDFRALLDVGRLRRLSLARCELGDEGCAVVAEALAFPQLGSRTLTALSLAGNAIGDAGALALAHALRSNRSLRLLDLADNRLHDEGALAILRSLAEFQLTLEEILTGRRLRMERVLRHAELLRRCLRAVRVALPGSDEARERRRLARASPAPPDVRWRAEHEVEAREMAAAAAMAMRELGPPLDPFPPVETVQRGGHLYSRGNTILNCLNLAYNSLSIISVRALLYALRGQVASAGGLVRVQLAGNPLPVCAPEYDAAAALMGHALFALAATNKQQPKKVPLKKSITAIT